VKRVQFVIRFAQIAVQKMLQRSRVRHQLPDDPEAFLEHVFALAVQASAVQVEQISGARGPFRVVRIEVRCGLHTAVTGAVFKVAFAIGFGWQNELWVECGPFTFACAVTATYATVHSSRINALRMRAGQNQVRPFKRQGWVNAFVDDVFDVIPNLTVQSDLAVRAQVILGRHQRGHDVLLSLRVES
jgi:hypothetical protein